MWSNSVVTRGNSLRSRSTLSGISHHLGQTVPLEEIGELQSAGVVPRLRDEGLDFVGIAEDPPSVLAQRAAQSTLEKHRPGQIGGMIYGTDMCPDIPGSGVGALTTTVQQLIKQFGRDRTVALAAGGHGCGNLAQALRVARGLIFVDGLDDVLLVVADSGRDGTRYLRSGLTVLSDGAAACSIVSKESRRSGFAVLGLETEYRAQIGEPPDTDDLVLARATAAVCRDAITRLLERLGMDRTEISHLVAGNYGSTSRRLLQLQTGVKSEVFSPHVGTMAHCFPANLLVSLQTLHEKQLAKPGDRCILISSSPRSWTAIAVEYQVPQWET